MENKLISVYVKGDRNSSSYYRFYQYFDKINGIDVEYHIMYPKWVENKFSPVGYQNLIIKILVYIVAYFRMLIALINDVIVRPRVVVVSRRIINKYMPLHFKWIFTFLLKHGTYFVWDFDDHILNSHELTKSDFNFFSIKANYIVVTHNYLKQLVPIKYHSKVLLLPTTDGDMYNEVGKPDLMNYRKATFETQLDLVWVAYSVNLKHLESVIPALDKAAQMLNNRKLILHVICDKPLEFNTLYLVIDNVKWTKEKAIKAMKESHIGIMPLMDTEYSKGKGGFKLVQYLSIGLPCIASNVGFNKEVIDNDVCGLLVNNEKEWCDAILKMGDYNVWKNYSSKAYECWAEKFSFEHNLSFWENLVLS